MHNIKQQYLYRAFAFTKKQGIACAVFKCQLTQKNNTIDFTLQFNSKDFSN
jgi:hypothetical protein